MKYTGDTTDGTRPTRAPVPPDEDSADGTYAALLAAGRKLFARRGFDGTSVRAITREAEANLGGITYHFGSKMGLYAAVLDQALRPLVGRVKEAARSPGHSLDRIEGVIHAYFDHLRDNEDLPRLLLQEIAAGKRPPPGVLSILRELAGTISGIVREGQEEESLRAGHPVLMALSSVSQPIYLTLVSPLALQVADLDVGDPEVQRAIRSHAIAFVRAGLEARRDAR